MFNLKLVVDTKSAHRLEGKRKQKKKMHGSYITRGSQIHGPSFSRGSLAVVLRFMAYVLIEVLLDSGGGVAEWLTSLTLNHEV